MTTKVNPPPQLKLPRAFQKDSEIEKFFISQNRILFQLWTRTGGSTDAVAAEEQGLREFDDLTALADSVPIRNAVSTAVDYTSAGSDIVICTAALDVTLSAEPDDKEIVTIKRAGGKVRALGNGRLIDGKASFVISKQYASRDIIYLLETDSWHII